MLLNLVTSHSHQSPAINSHQSPPIVTSHPIVTRYSVELHFGLYVKGRRSALHSVASHHSKVSRPAAPPRIAFLKHFRLWCQLLILHFSEGNFSSSSILGVFTLFTCKRVRAARTRVRVRVCDAYAPLRRAREIYRAYEGSSYGYL